jgi:hypothetical protein
MTVGMMLAALGFRSSATTIRDRLRHKGMVGCPSIEPTIFGCRRYRHLNGS